MSDRFNLKFKYTISDKLSLEVSQNLENSLPEGLRETQIMLILQAACLRLDNLFLSGEIPESVYNDEMRSLKYRFSKLYATFPKQEGSSQ